MSEWIHFIYWLHKFFWFLVPHPLKLDKKMLTFHIMKRVHFFVASYLKKKKLIYESYYLLTS